MTIISNEFKALIDSKVSAVLTNKPNPKAKVIEAMGLNSTEALVFTCMLDIGMYPEIKSQRGKHGGMYIGNLVTAG